MEWSNFGLPHYFQAPGVFEHPYRCHSFAILGKPDLETCGKIILPPSALDKLSRMKIDFPMLFSATYQGRKTHCGVLEFTAEEGRCYMPYWMMQYLLIEEGAFITIKSAFLQQGSYVKLQPHSTDFIELANPRAVLERALRSFSTLTKGEVIMIRYNDRNYYINVLEVRPDDIHHAVSIVEADVEVDFAPPLDYQEPKPAATSAISIPGSGTKSDPSIIKSFEDESIIIPSEAGKPSKRKRVKIQKPAGEALSTSPSSSSSSDFVPFGGEGRTASGRKPRSRTPSSATLSSSPPVSTSSSKLSAPSLSTSPSTSKPSSSSSTTSSSSSPSAAAAAEEPAPSFVPFAGKGHSLKP